MFLGRQSAWRGLSGLEHTQKGQAGRSTRNSSSSACRRLSAGPVSTSPHADRLAAGPPCGSLQAMVLASFTAGRTFKLAGPVAVEAALDPVGHPAHHLGIQPVDLQRIPRSRTTAKRSAQKASASRARERGQWPHLNNTHGEIMYCRHCSHPPCRRARTGTGTS
mgnify:CR=1 FL=1